MMEGGEGEWPGSRTQARNEVYVAVLVVFLKMCLPLYFSFFFLQDPCPARLVQFPTMKTSSWRKSLSLEFLLLPSRGVGKSQCAWVYTIRPPGIVATHKTKTDPFYFWLQLAVALLRHMTTAPQFIVKAGDGVRFLLQTPCKAEGTCPQPFQWSCSTEDDQCKSNLHPWCTGKNQNQNPHNSWHDPGVT